MSEFAPSRSTLLRDPRDRWILALGAGHVAALVLLPSAATVALLLWWNANALSHQLVHRRWFHARWLDDLASAWFTVLLGLPQRLWRQRHLAHHAGTAWRLRLDPGVVAESAVALSLWTSLALVAPGFLLTAYAPGFVLGLFLCALHGHFEHAGRCAGGISHRGRLYNLLFLNDGLHAEHHARPRAHAFDLARVLVRARTSPWPPVLRWVEGLPAGVLDALERAVLRSPALQQLLVERHARAVRALWAGRSAPMRVIVVGGGLFPRSALVARALWPRAEVAVLDADAAHLGAAASLLPPGIAARTGRFTPGERLDADLVFLPLALRGERRRAYASPPAPACLVHDWAWRPRGEGRLVAWWLLKRINLVAAGHCAGHGDRRRPQAARGRAWSANANAPASAGVRAARIAPP